MGNFAVSSGVHEATGWDMITLTGAGHEARILVDHGFNLYYWTYNGGELLMEPVDYHMPGAKYGIPLLFPTPNRLRAAQYTWRGKTTIQRKRGQTVAIHGLVLDEVWQAKAWSDGENAYAQGEITINEDSALYEAYPFPCRLILRYTLSANGLAMDIQVENLGSEDLPFGFAIHPYFSKRGDANRVFITAPLKRIYENDENLLPSGRIMNVGDTRLDISDGYHSVESLDLDNVYRGMTQDLCARVVYPGHVRITLRGSDCFRNLIVFTPKTRPGFCIEHQTCSTDALNLHARGLVDEAGLQILPPGQVWKAWIALTTDNEDLSL